jgi:cytochrome oxidase assembly protein ShyY1
MTTPGNPPATRPDGASAGGATRPGIKAILTPGWLGIIAGALAFAAGCWLILAPWQFSRNAEREAQNAQIEAALAAAPVPVTELLHADAQPDAAATWRVATATGTFVPDQQAYVRLRQASGQDAREIVLPFRLADGTVVLVDRGYLLNTDLAAGRLPAEVPTGVVTITGRVSADQPDPSGRQEQSVDGRREVYGLDSTTLLAGPDPSLRGFVQLTADSPAALIPIGVPNRDSGPFLSYALQWVVFGLVALLAAGVFAWREVTTPYPDRIAPAPPAPSPPNDRATANASADGAAEPDAPATDDKPQRSPVPANRQRFDRSQLYD